MRIHPTFILCVSLFLVMVGFGIILPVLPFFSLNLGANSFQIGLLMASYSLMQFIFSPFWGSLSDKYGRKPIIMIGLLGFAVSFVLFGLADSLFMLFAARIAGGILSSACLPTAMAYMADVTSEEERGAGMGILGAALGLGMIVGPSIGGFFSAIHFSTPFFFSAGIAILNLLFAAFFLEETKREHSKREQKYNRFRHLLSLRGYIAYIFFLVFLLSFSMANFEGTFSLFAKERLNFGSMEMGWVFAAMGIILVIIQGFLIGKLIRKFGEDAVIKTGLLLSAVGYTLTIFSHNLWTLIFFVGIAAVGHGLCRPSLASIISKDTEFEEGVTMGAMQSVDSLGRIFGPICGGVLFSLGMYFPYICGGSINFVFFLIFLLI